MVIAQPFVFDLTVFASTAVGRAMLRVRAVLLVLFVAIAGWLILTTPFPAPDELEHLSTVAGLQESGRLVPEYRAQTTLRLDDFTRWDTRPNYIGHPSPYYLLLARVLDRRLPPARAILLPRVVSFGLMLMGVLLAWRAGVGWYGRDAGAFWVFGVGLTLCPELLSVARQVNNDALAVLGGGLAYWGVSGRLGGERWRVLGVAAGLALAAWAKPNAGLEVGLLLGAMLLLERAGRGRLAGAMVAGGVIGLLPYVPIVLRYGAIVPVSAEGIWEVHSMGSFAAYWPVFLFNLGNSWGFLKTGVWPVTEGLEIVRSLAFWVTAVAVASCVWFGRRRGASAVSSVAAAAVVAFALVVPIHLYFAAMRLGFSIPAASFRYYLPLWPGLAHAAAYAVGSEARPRRRMALMAACGLTLALGWAP